MHTLPGGPSGHLHRLLSCAILKKNESEIVTMPTLAHFSIRHCLQMIGPFRPSPALSEESQRQFFACITGIYQHMLQDPEGYFVFPGPYEAYMEKKKTLPATPGPEKMHKTDSRESTLRNTVQQAISFYASFFWHLGIRAEGVKESRLFLQNEKYREALSQMERYHGAEHNPLRYQLLEKHGLETEENENGVFIRHAAYPSMMEALFFLCQAKESKYQWMNYLRLAFSNAEEGMPAVSDVLLTLPDAMADIIRQLENALHPLPVKPQIKPLRGITSDFQWKAEYTLKGKNVLGFYADHSTLTLCIYFNDHKNISAFASRLQTENPSLFPWFCRQFPQRLCKCPSNRLVHLGDEKRRICGLSNRAEILNPTAEDVENALYVLKTFRGL